ncbi:Mitogen-activated protein kinase kinase 7 [Zea mays]|jgi:mitogen-activated protein kinase kinase 9|uniref:Mitogen-activated protein kinase kinase 7 n=1 Tax=Zea mays TaxID=4577 RepID=A0A3L6FKP7_MAIZE|nr:Mitogen-activated protein kinase kinase 7 [Zea mays]
MTSSVNMMMPHEMFRRTSAAPAPHQTVSVPAPEKLRLSDLNWIGDLGEGGFARVYKARHCRTGEVFALKLSFYPDPLAAEEEAEVHNRAAGAPHVIDFYALFRGPGGKFAFVLEYMDAGSLGRLLRRRGGLRMPEAAVAELAAQCVMGLAQLHSRGVAHLDVKPDNILANARGEIKMSDFNLSRILYGGSGERLLVPITGGTKMYFSPERFAPKARAGPHGAMAADVWGLGVTILELFLGRLSLVPGVEKPSAEELKRAICDGKPPSVPEGADASAELRGFLAACLEKEPARRATVAQLLSHPFFAQRDVHASRRALREIIVDTL